MRGTATARVREQLADLLIAALEDALVEISEIETRRSGVGIEPNTFQFRAPQAGTVEQHERMKVCRRMIETALSSARDYAKGPRA